MKYLHPDLVPILGELPCFKYVKSVHDGYERKARLLIK